MAAKRLSTAPALPARPALPAFVPILLGAFGLWTSFGAVTVLRVDQRAVRIGVLPSPWWLAALVVVGFAVAAGRLVARRRDALLLGTLALLPWLPMPVPAVFLAWSGPVRGWLWIGIAAVVIRASPPAWVEHIAANPRRAPAAAAALAAVAYLAGAHAVAPRLPTGDEPHYLVITQSLLIDHDLKIENNHRRGDYRSFYGGDLRPDYLRRGVDGEIYSIHAPGLAVFVAPAFAMFGYPGVMGFLALVSAAATGLVWRTVWHVTADAAASWFAWASVALSVPFFFQSFIAYPDATGGALVMVGVATALAGGDASERRLFAAGAALAALPWLHTRFAIEAAVLAAVILARQRQSDRLARRAAALMTAPVISAFAWFGFFYAVYGTADPRAPYAGSVQSEWANLARGIPGLLFDQQFGLLPNAPVYACAAAGFVLLFRRRTRLAVEIGLSVLPYSVAVAAYYMWWGGFSSPARFLTPVLLPLAVPIGVWFHSSSRGGRALGIGALAVSLLMTATIAAVDRGALLYNNRDGASKLLGWLSPVVNLSIGLPSLFQESPARAVVYSIVWIAILAVAAWVTVVLSGRRPSARASIVAPATCAAAAMVALTIVWHMNGADPLTPDRGAMALLSIDGSQRGQIAASLNPFGRLSVGEIPSRLTIADVAPRAVPSDGPLLVLHDVAAATYEIEATAASTVRGRLSIALDRDAVPLWTWDLSAGARVIRERFTTPVPLRTAFVNLDPAARAHIERVVVRPVPDAGLGARLASGPAEGAARYGSTTVFLLDRDSYLEPRGAWVGGGASARFVLVPDSSGPRQLFVRTPPVANRVGLQSGGWRDELTLPPGGNQTVNLPAAVAGQPMLLQVSASAGARPTAFEPGSTDSRLLGCWIELR